MKTEKEIAIKEVEKMEAENDVKIEKLEVKLRTLTGISERREMK